MSDAENLVTRKTFIQNLIHIALVLNIILLEKCDCAVTIYPTNAVVIATTSAKFVCTSKSNNQISWFKRRTESDDIKIVTGKLARYAITDNSQHQQSTLSINSTIIEDSGEFYCKTVSGNSNVAKLEVITPPPTWFPSCRQYPERLTSGTDVEITCASSINPTESKVELPYLAWTQDQLIISNIPFQNTTYVSVKYTRTVNRDDHGKQFVCQATLSNLRNPPSCSVTLFVDWGGNDNIVPYIIVAVLSIIAIVLFGIVIIFVFRFRECKYCKETVPEPQQVLDMSALQEGVGVPMTVISDQSSEDEAVDLRKSKTKTKKQSKRSINSNGSSRQTSQGQKQEDKELNFKDNIQLEENKKYETKTKDIGLIPLSNNRPTSISDTNKYRPKSSQTRNTSGFSVKDYPHTASQSKPKSLPNKRSKQPIHNINNLGSSGSSAPAYGSPKRGRSKTDDMVVYADLDFARNPGMNITKDEYS